MIKNLYYEFYGECDPTIVFLHGWGMDSSCFDRVINKLPLKQKILKIDFFSFGKSESVEEWFDTYEYAYHVFLLIKRLNLKNVILIGHSFGGRIAMILSSIFDINVKSIVLTSSAGINRFNIIKKIKIIHYKFLKYLVGKNIIGNHVLSHYGSDDYKKLNPKIRKVFVRVINQDLKFLLSCIRVPVSLVWDKKDNITPYWICKFLYKTLNNPNIYLFKNGKHYVFLHNIDKFANIIKTLIE